MQIFYVPGIKGNTCLMDENESKHCIRVLRMKKGDMIKLVDGTGNLYDGLISHPDPAGCTVTILGVIRDFEKRGYRLHIAISPIKNQDRFEWFVEKSVEIGIDKITPLLCRNTEKSVIKRARINNIIISAMKQSIKAFMPVLSEPMAFEEFIDSDPEGLRMIAHCKLTVERENISQVYKKNKDAVIMIGPEGDFSEDELKLALNKGFRPVHFGTSRLRTETAGIIACHSIYILNQ